MPAVIRKEIKEEMLAKIKGGVKPSEVADQYGVTRRSVFGWLSGQARTTVSFEAYQKIKRERDGLLTLVGELVLEQRRGGKNRSR